MTKCSNISVNINTSFSITSSLDFWIFTRCEKTENKQFHHVYFLLTSFKFLYIPKCIHNFQISCCELYYFLTLWENVDFKQEIDVIVQYKYFCLLDFNTFKYVLFCTIICIIFTSLCKNLVKLT